MRHADFASVLSRQIVIYGKGERHAIQNKILRGGSKARENAKASTGAVKSKETPRGKELNFKTGVVKLPAVQ